MRYEAPAVDGRFEVSAELGFTQVSPTQVSQPVWRQAEDSTPKPYPADPRQD